MTTADRRAAKKAKSKKSHEHIPGVRCLVCRPVSQEQPPAQPWRPPTITMDQLLFTQARALQDRRGHR